MNVRSQLTLIAVIVTVFAIANAMVLFRAQGRLHELAVVEINLNDVRARSQRIIKLELAGRSNDPDLATTTEAAHQLRQVRVDDVAVDASLDEADRAWTELLGLIERARSDAALKETLLNRSEDYFKVVDRTVETAETLLLREMRTAQTLGWIMLVLSGALALFVWGLSRRLTSSLAESISSLASTSAEVTAAVEQQERFAAQHAAATSQTTSTMAELATSARLSADQAASASNQSRAVLNLVRDGSEGAEKTAAAITGLKEKVASFGDQILRLSEQVGQIGTITTLVGDLANQTNMLALNAAVEAVRAGDQGKGFAIVAAEIRKLADQSKKSSERISALVTDIQQATNASVMVAEQGIRNAEQGVALVSQTTQMFNSVTGSVNSVFDAVQQISMNARQQSDAVGQVVEAITSLSDGAKETARSVAQTRLGMERLTDTSSMLKRMVGV